MESERSPRLLPVAVGVFLVGVLAVVALFVVPAVSGTTAPLFVYLLTLCAPLGFILGVIVALRSGRRVR